MLAEPTASIEQQPDDLVDVDPAREIVRLRRVLQGVRGDHTRLRHEMHMLRLDLAAVFGLCRLLVDRTQSRGALDAPPRERAP